MTISALKTRSSQCELCTSTDGLLAFEIEGKSKKGADAAVLVCPKCENALLTNDYSDTNHWRGLTEAIWSEHTPVKVLSYRVLHNLRSEPWAQDLMDQIYLEDEDMIWAKEGLSNDSSNSGGSKATVDSNGTPLLEGDSVTLIKDLDVKGANFTAKRGTLVKGIRLTENHEHIEGKVNGIHIVLLTKFLKKV